MQTESKFEICVPCHCPFITLQKKKKNPTTSEKSVFGDKNIILYVYRFYWYKTLFEYNIVKLIDEQNTSNVRKQYFVDVFCK